MKRMNLLAAATAATGLLAHGGSCADPIATDRPDFVESSQTVGAGRFQIETSVARERNKRDGAHTTTRAMPTLLRFGVSPDWELRLETDGYARVSGDSPATTSGMTDLSVGLKWQMQDSEGGTPAVAWLLHADLPTGAQAFRGHGVRPSLRAVLEWELANDFSAGLMPGVIADTTESGRRYGAAILAGVIGKAWTDRFRTFVEVAAQQIAKSSNGGSLVTLDVGAAYLVSDDVQVDTALCWGLNRQTPNSCWTVGLSVRF